jgi:hypothetical protein
MSDRVISASRNLIAIAAVDLICIKELQTQ